MPVVKKPWTNFLVFGFLTIMLHVKIDENGFFFKIYHGCDLDNLLQVVNIDELINNSLS